MTVEIQGLFTMSNGEEAWCPLYQYDNDMLGRATYKHIIGLDSWPRELEHYDDFRVIDLPSEAPAARRTTPTERTLKRSRSAENGDSGGQQRKRRKKRQKGR